MSENDSYMCEKIWVNFHTCNMSCEKWGGGGYWKWATCQKMTITCVKCKIMCDMVLEMSLSTI